MGYDPLAVKQRFVGVSLNSYHVPQSVVAYNRYITVIIDEWTAD